MSDPQSGPSVGQNSPTKDITEKGHAPAERDWFLSLFVNLANDNGHEVGVTLNVGGTIVSGVIVSGASYFEGFAADMASAFGDPEIAESIRTSYSSYAQLYPRRAVGEDEEFADEERPTPTPTYIHLRNAGFFLNGQPPLPGNRGVWWRGRLEAVDGFSLGTLGVPEDSET